MPLPIGPLLQRALDLLADGEWHDYHETVRKVAVLVPPGEAIRAAERQRLEVARRRHYLEQARVIPRSNEELIRFGSNLLARQALSNRTRFVTEVEGDAKATSRRVKRRIKLKGVGGDGETHHHGL